MLKCKDEIQFLIPCLGFPTALVSRTKASPPSSLAPVHFSLLPPSSRTIFTPRFMGIFSENGSVVWSAETQPPG